MEELRQLACESFRDLPRGGFEFGKLMRALIPKIIVWPCRLVDGGHIVLHENIELSCSSDGDETSCSDNMVIISDGEGFDLDELHELHAEDGDHKVIMIKKHVITED